MTGNAARERAQSKPFIVIIGAGISGMLMGIKLLERGCSTFAILEKGETLGGTWRDNTYPGVACDVAAHLYTYSFARDPWWKSRYAQGRDIWRHYHRVARRRGLLPFIRYRQEVDTAVFDGDAWVVTCKDGQASRADIVIAANGRLHHPQARTGACITRRCPISPAWTALPDRSSTPRDGTIPQRSTASGWG